MMQFDAILFDMDGVLIDSEPVHNAKWCEVLKDHDIDIDESSFLRFIGVPDKEIALEFVSRYGLAKQPEELIGIKQAKYKDFLESGIHPIPVLTAALKSLNNYKIGLVTASCKADAEMVSGRLDIGSLLDVIVGGDEIVNNKPHPDIYLKATVKLNVAPDRCIAVEDSHSGILAAKRAGMYVVAVTNALHHPGLAEADFVCDNTLQAIEHIKTIAECFK
ncbi:MAG: HAD family phosphatase [Chitinophagaceae bacterium]|nr:HAD family phosphatase [Chitinophagaceae bacterium]